MKKVSTVVKTAQTKQQKEISERKAGAFNTYLQMYPGTRSLFFAGYYELIQFICSGLPGLPGFGLRSLFYPGLFSRCGSQPAFGRNMLLRGPKAIQIGAKCLFDDLCVLDARGEVAEIYIGDHVSVGRSTIIAAKGGQISLADGVNIGSNCRIATTSSVSIGSSTLVAAYSYIGPGNHQHGDADQALIEQEMENRGGVSIGKHVWVGARSTILDGVTIGDRAIIGAHALVRDDVASGDIVAGTPAKVIGRVGEKS